MAQQLTEDKEGRCPSNNHPSRDRLKGKRSETAHGTSLTLKTYSYDNRFMDFITNIFDGSQLRIGDICRQTLGRVGQ